MRIIGCDLHARQQTLAMLDVETGEVEEHVLQHEGDQVGEFYAGLTGPVRVGMGCGARLACRRSAPWRCRYIRRNDATRWFACIGNCKQRSTDWTRR